MIVILKTGIDKSAAEYDEIMNYLAQQASIQIRIHEEVGAQHVLTELYLVGDTSALNQDDINSFPAVERTVRISAEYRILGRHKDDSRSTQFTYNGVTFSQNNLNIFAGLCAVDNPKHVELMMKACQEHGQVCTRMGCNGCNPHGATDHRHCESGAPNSAAAIYRAPFFSADSHRFSRSSPAAARDRF